MEKEKNNKGLIILVIMLVLIILGLIGFIVYDKVLSKNEEVKQKNKTSNITEKNANQENIDFLNIEEIKSEIKIPSCEEDECELVKKGNINLKIKKVSDDAIGEYNAIFINDVNTKVVSDITDIIYFLDDDNVLIGSGAEELSYSIYNNKGEFVTNIDDKIILSWASEISFKNNVFNLITLTYGFDYEFGACQYKDDAPAKAIETLEYLGNGKVGNSKIVKYLTTNEIIREKYGMSCDEIKNSTDPKLEYARSNILEYKIRK